jgi:DNA-binding MarR family transcriptional regulator
MDIPKDNFVKSVKRLYLLMNRHIEDELKLYGLARSQFQVLYHISKAGNITQKKLQQAMQVEPATLTVIIDGLAKKGFLERVSDKTDKRINILQLTAEGKKLRKKIPSLHEIIEERMFHDFAETERKSVIALVEKIIKNLEGAKESK